MKYLWTLLVLAVLFSCKQSKEETIVTQKETNENSQTIEVKTDTASVASSETFKKLQGTWRNIDAPLSSLTFQGNRAINTYDGVDTKKNITFTLSDSCGTKETENIPKESERYILTSGDAVECYYIVKLDATSLVLGYWGVETALRFEKI